MGKEIKFTTEKLYDIIHKFFQDTQHLGIKMNFSNLARYAKEDLKINDIEYYHFSRNKEISAKVKEYNQTRKSSVVQYSNDNSYFTTLNVKEFIKSNIGNQDRLTFYLNNLQEMQKKLYDRTLDAEKKVRELEQKLAEEKAQKEKYKDKYREVKKNAQSMKEEIRVFKEALKIKEENQLIDALNSTGLYLVERENDTRDEEEKENIKTLNDTNGKNIEKLMEQFPDID